MREKKKGFELFVLAEGTLNRERQVQSLFISLGKELNGMSLVSLIALSVGLAYILFYLFISFYLKTIF